MCVYVYMYVLLICRIIRVVMCVSIQLLLYYVIMLMLISYVVLHYVTSHYIMTIILYYAGLRDLRGCQGADPLHVLLIIAIANNTSYCMLLIIIITTAIVYC